MIIRTTAFAAFITALYTATAAQDVGGLYQTECTYRTGASCSAAVVIEMTSDDTCHIKWGDGSSGICMLKGTVFSYAAVVSAVPQLGIYDVSADGTIEGVFIDDYNGGGKEKMTPVR